MKTLNTLTAVAAFVTLGRVAQAQSAMAQMRLAAPRSTAAPASASTADPGFVGLTTFSASATGDTAAAPQSSHNPYVGAQAGYVFGGGEFASNLVANGSVVYDVLHTPRSPGDDTTSHFSLSIRGNVSSLVAAKDGADRDKQAQSLISGAQGIRISVEPFLALPSVGFLKPGMFASAGWKLNAVKDATDSTRYLALGRFALGIEGVFGPKDESRSPIVIDISPVYSTFAGRDYRSIAGLEKSIWSGELTVVLPVGASTGFLTEAIIAQHALPVWRTGLVLSAASK